MCKSEIARPILSKKIQQVLNKSFGLRLSMSNFILKEATLGEFRGNGSRGLDAATLSSFAFGVCCWQRHKGICSWIGLLSGDGILFPELSVPLKRRRQSARSKPTWAHRGAGSLTPQTAVPWWWGLADPGAQVWQRCLLQGCLLLCHETMRVHGEKSKPTAWMVTRHQTHFLQEVPANSWCEQTQLLQTAIMGFSFLSLLSVPDLAWLIHNTCKQNILQHSSILYYTEWWVSCRWPGVVLQPVLSKWQKAARQCRWNLVQRITWSLHISSKQERGGREGYLSRCFQIKHEGRWK